MKQYKAILWDCDGVLIDSEKLSCGVNAEFMRECGHDVSLETFLTRYMGKGRKQILADVLTETGLDLTPHYANGNINERQNDLFRKELKAIEGIAEILIRADVPIAVASGSEMTRLNLTLEITGLKDLFKGHIYSAEMVPHGKPAPDIFLHAAKMLGVAPEDCLVVEDGIHGIHAAKAARMDVVAYLGGSHIFPELRTQILATKPGKVFETMRELQSYLFAGRVAEKSGARAA